jgi:hypothetical protein
MGDLLRKRAPFSEGIMTLIRNFVLAAVLLPLVPSQDPGQCCQEIEKALFCNGCNLLVPDSDCRRVDFDREEFMACKACAKRYGDDAAAYSRARVLEIEVCVRVHYECVVGDQPLGCGKVRREEEQCCGQPMAKKVSRARIFYVCSECVKWGEGHDLAEYWRNYRGQVAQHRGSQWWKDQPAECPRHDNKKLDPRCSQAGIFPHVPKR